MAEFTNDNIVDEEFVCRESIERLLGSPRELVGNNAEYIDSYASSKWC